jgi:IS4 transposase
VRDRKIDIVKFVWTLILGFGVDSKRTIAGLRRAYERSTGVHLVPSSFYDRFTPLLVKMLKMLVDDVMGALIPATSDNDGVFAAFRDVLAADATVIRLHDMLAKGYAACRTNHTKAAAKLHAVINVMGRGMEKIRLTEERTKEGTVIKIGDWVEGRLLIFDLGYYKFQLFDRIDRRKGYFLSRLKETGNPLITAVHVGSGVGLVGEKLQDVIGKLRRPVIDCEVQVRFQRRVYRGNKTWARASFRLVGIRNIVTKRYHLYLTNIPIETVEATQIASLYASRWSVELLFRELKRSYRIDDLPSAKKEVVESLIYASILTLAASRELYKLVAQQRARSAGRMPEERWGIVFTSVALDVLLVLVGPTDLSRALSWRTLRYLRHESVDPNVGRRLLIDRVVGTGGA